MTLAVKVQMVTAYVNELSRRRVTSGVSRSCNGLVGSTRQDEGKNESSEGKKYTCHPRPQKYLPISLRTMMVHIDLLFIVTRVFG
jgi:hypothetical protein